MFLTHLMHSLGARGQRPRAVSLDSESAAAPASLESSWASDALPPSLALTLPRSDSSPRMLRRPGSSGAPVVSSPAPFFVSGRLAVAAEAPPSALSCDSAFSSFSMAPETPRNAHDASACPPWLRCPASPCSAADQQQLQASRGERGDRGDAYRCASETLSAPAPPRTQQAQQQGGRRAAHACSGDLPGLADSLSAICAANGLCVRHARP
eukprot:m51a1_g7140 hypothetical protein (210) ;mRNA; r:291824-292453